MDENARKGVTRPRDTLGGLGGAASGGRVLNATRIRILLGRCAVVRPMPPRPGLSLRPGPAPGRAAGVAVFPRGQAPPCTPPWVMCTCLCACVNLGVCACECVCMCLSVCACACDCIVSVLRGRRQVCNRERPGIHPAADELHRASFACGTLPQIQTYQVTQTTLCSLSTDEPCEEAGRSRPGSFLQSCAHIKYIAFFLVMKATQF